MFRFTIRDVLWLTVVVGLGLAGWFNRSALWEGRAKAAAQALKSAGYSSSWSGDGVLVQFSPRGIRKDAVLFRSSGAIEDPASDQETTGTTVFDALQRGPDKPPEK